MGTVYYTVYYYTVLFVLDVQERGMSVGNGWMDTLHTITFSRAGKSLGVSISSTRVLSPHCLSLSFPLSQSLVSTVQSLASRNPYCVGLSLSSLSFRFP